MPVRIIVP